MATKHPAAGLYDPRNGDPPLRAEGLRLDRRPFEPARSNYFGIYWISSGSGAFWADTAQHTFEPDSLLFFVPYQHIRFEPSAPTRGEVVQFHANFLCVETFHAEVGCSGILFNDPYGGPAVRLDDGAKAEVPELIARIHREQSERGLAHDEMLLAYVKVLLILATRLKTPSPDACRTGLGDLRDPVLATLRDLIEENYRRLHSPAEYAAMLHMTPKTLGRIVRENLGTTLTDLIRQRILTHAKWHLLHTLRPVKEIAREVGFVDELYFSRLFKKATGLSPTFFREFETEIRGGSNLSMLSDDAPIHPSPTKSDNPLVATRKPGSAGKRTMG